MFRIPPTKLVDCSYSASRGSSPRVPDGVCSIHAVLDRHESHIDMNSTPQSNLPDYTPIFLVGFMGAGKTTVGRELAAHLGYDFYDLDEVIAAQTGKSVQEIFADLGEDEFRKLESKAIQTCGDFVRAVVALGGGAYVSEKNRTVLRGIGKTVWLDCPLEVCLQRIRGDRSRPLLGNTDQMQSLLAQRAESYAEADYTIRAGDLSPEELVLEITRQLRHRAL